MAIELIVRVGATYHNVLCSSGTTVSVLKKQLEPIVGVATIEQILIYCGRRMMDERVLESYGLQLSHVIHLVKRPQRAPLAQPNILVAPPMAAGLVIGNVLSDLTGARYAGLINLPSTAIFGPDGGMGPIPVTQEIRNLRARLERATEQLERAKARQRRSQEALVKAKHKLDRAEGSHH